jgi:hypothetical protein
MRCYFSQFALILGGQLPPDKSSGLHFQFSLRGWSPIGRPFLGTERDWLVDFGDAAPQIPSRYQQPAPAGRLHRHLIRPVIADDLPVGATRVDCLRGHIYLALQFLPPMNWRVSLETVL